MSDRDNRRCTAWSPMHVRCCLPPDHEGVHKHTAWTWQIEWAGDSGPMPKSFTA